MQWITIVDKKTNKIYDLINANNVALYTMHKLNVVDIITN